MKRYDKMLKTKLFKKNLIPRFILILLVLFPFFYFNEFYFHFKAYFTGNIINRLITQEWHIVLFSILLFVAFLIPLTYRRKAKWAEKGLVSAFFISLFVEMYGIPFTLLFASKYFAPSVDLPSNFVNFNLFGVGFGMDLAMTYSAFLMIIGATLIIVGWISLYNSVRKSKEKNIKQESNSKNKNIFVTNGIYSYSRHPQYLGFILVIIGWFIGWPTIITLVFAPILIYKYVRVCLTEEKEVYPELSDYRKRVPMFV